MSCKLLLIPAGIVVLGLVNAPKTHASPPGSGCVLLTPAQIQRALGDGPSTRRRKLSWLRPLATSRAHTAPIKPNEAGTWL
jgi:hypothetical protein